ncbi:MAG: hypothetical protein ACE5GA_00425 [Candidatus Zixiibacteriota bacterium]
MSLILHRIRAWRLPRPLLFAFGAVFLALSLITARVAWRMAEPGLAETLTLSGSLINMQAASFRSSEIVRFRFTEFCSEFRTFKYDSFDYQALVRDFKSGVSVRFTVRVADSSLITECREVELFSLETDSIVYFSLASRNESARSARSFVAGGTTVLLIAAGLLALFVGAASLKDSDGSTEVWKRSNVFKP